MNGRQKRLTATVLHVRNFGDAHRIVEVLTAEEGRVSALARNARASKRRFAGVLDLFATLELELIPANGLWQLESARLSQARLGLRSDLQRLQRANLCCEAVRLLVAEHQAAALVHDALISALDCLETGDLLGAASFYPRLLAAAGIAPDFAVCVRCGNRPHRVAGVDVDRGGVVCTGCAPTRPALPHGAVATFGGAACVDTESADAVLSCALDWVEAQAGRSLRSRQFSHNL